MSASAKSCATGMSDGDDYGAYARRYRYTDPPLASDRRRIRDSRMRVRDLLRAAPSGDGQAAREIFREEMGANVRSASPFALSLVASLGLSIGQLLDRITPAPRWPRAPALSERPAILFRRPREPYRRFVVIS